MLILAAILLFAIFRFSLIIFMRHFRHFADAAVFAAAAAAAFCRHATPPRFTPFHFRFSLPPWCHFSFMPLLLFYAAYAFDDMLRHYIISASQPFIDAFAFRWWCHFIFSAITPFCRHAASPRLAPCHYFSLLWLLLFRYYCWHDSHFAIIFAISIGRLILPAIIDAAPRQLMIIIAYAIIIYY